MNIIAINEQYLGAALGSMVAVIVLAALAAVEIAPFATRRDGLAVGRG